MTAAELRHEICALETELGEARAKLARLEGDAHILQRAANDLETLGLNLHKGTAWVDKVRVYGQRIELTVRAPDIHCVLTMPAYPGALLP